MNESTLTPNTLALLALCNEYCTALQNCRELAENADDDTATDRPFLRSMINLLPRIYVCATDMARQCEANEGLYEEVMFDQSLTEDQYDEIRRDVENILGADDTYLEVFHEDMKYSDTPIAASISEGLTDLFQVFYNFLDTVREAPDYVVQGALLSLAEDFRSYWSMTLCNVLRAVNHVYYNTI